jgi:cell division cycle 20, cofactor of APC complex
MNLDLCRRALLTGEKRRRAEEANNSRDRDTSPSPSHNNPQETPLQKEFKRRMLSSLCNVKLEDLDEDAQPRGLFSYGAKNENTSNHLLPTLSSGVRLENPYSHDGLRSVLQTVVQDFDPSTNHSVSKKINRKVSSAPTRILDAPDIVNDYYLQLISWGKDNILAVALAQSVYLWNAATGEIQHLVSTEAPDDYITSVAWCTIPGRTKYIAIGTNGNVVEIYDAEVLRKVRTMTGHSGRVCSLAWSHQWLTSGARDSLILQHDIRSHHNVVSTYEGHEQEVCGLKWNEEGSALASGGNENYLCLWDAAMSGRSSFQQRNRRQSSADSVAPRLILTQHKAAVKALDWCPFHRGLLASGGGTADRTIKFWNSSSGAMLNSIDTGSQVCSVLWSKHQREICSSHGYSENQLILWKYPTMTKIKELTGHTERVLNMDMSPDGASVVSAAADETLRFWNVFGTPSCRPSSSAFSMSGELSFGMPTIR